MTSFHSNVTVLADTGHSAVCGFTAPCIPSALGRITIKETVGFQDPLYVNVGVEGAVNGVCKSGGAATPNTGPMEDRWPCLFCTVCSKFQTQVIQLPPCHLHVELCVILSQAHHACLPTHLSLLQAPHFSKGSKLGVTKPPARKLGVTSEGLRRPKR